MFRQVAKKREEQFYSDLELKLNRVYLSLGRRLNGCNHLFIYSHFIRINFYYTFLAARNLSDRTFFIFLYIIRDADKAERISRSLKACKICDYFSTYAAKRVACKLTTPFSLKWLFYVRVPEIYLLLIE